MRCSEWIGIAYFVYLGVIAWTHERPVARRLLATVASAAAGAAVVLIARHGGPAVRDWTTYVVIGAGYYVTALLFVRPSPALESWLLARDRRCFGDPTARFSHWPAWVAAYLQVVYAGCFLLLPVGFLVLVRSGHAGQADRYWSTLAIAELGSFGFLPFLQARPPWALERPAVLRDAAGRRLASIVITYFSTRLNTLPSGHAAGSVAVALAVLPAEPLHGVWLLAVALSIVVASVVGRYHYIVDVVSGTALGVAAWAVVWLAGC